MLFKTNFYNSLAVSIILLLLPVGCDKLGGSDTDLTEREKMGIRDEGWTKFSDMSVDPAEEETKPWVKQGDPNSIEIKNGILSIETDGTATGFYTIGDDRIDNEPGTTVEIRIRVLKTPTDPAHHDAAILTLQNGTWEGKLAFFPDRIIVYDKNVPIEEYGVDTTEFHTYRMLVFRDNIDVYLDGELVISSLLSNQVKGKRIFFGDLNPTDNQNIKAAVSYVCYRTWGAS